MPDSLRNDIEPPLWSAAAASEAAFVEEQETLGRIWTFVGFLSDVAKDGDWFRATLANKSIFVQRFGDTLRGFENRCAHRFYPLRMEDKGNGPVVCGFHHWRYNQDGVALGIPNCQEVFGKTPRELDARLKPVEIATCGSLVFGRFTPPEGGPTLEEFLGDAHPILTAFCPAGVRTTRFRRKLYANWKFTHHISLDDYHIVAIHPSTFGKGGYLRNEVLKYYRIGLHSAYLETDHPDPLAGMVAACRDGTYRPRHYVVVNLFPNLVISQFHAVNLFGVEHWFMMVIRYVPVSAGRSMVQAWMYPSPFPLAETALSRPLRPIMNVVMPPIVSYFAQQVMEEDNVACEKLQTIAHQFTEPQIVSAQEKRIGWFEESYAQVMVEGRRARAEGRF